MARLLQNGAGLGRNCVRILLSPDDQHFSRRKGNSIFEVEHEEIPREHISTPNATHYFDLDSG